MNITVSAQLRHSAGRGEARRQRRENRIPAVIYGACDPMSVSFSARELSMHMQKETFRSSVLTLDIEGKKISALLRDVQMHPYKREILHVDFQAVKDDQPISASVPLHFINADDSPGVKLHRAIFTSIENEVSLHCLPQDLPEFINVDVGALDLGKSIHLSELTPPPGVTFDALARGEDPALAVMSGQAAEEEEPAAEGGDAAQAKDEPAAS